MVISRKKQFNYVLNLDYPIIGNKVQIDLDDTDSITFSRFASKKAVVMCARAFATEHSPVKVGDYISGSIDTIRVESWEITKRTYEYNSLPCLVYRGMTCKKDGTPRKNPKKCSIYQCSLLRVNGEPVKNHGYGE